MLFEIYLFLEILAVIFMLIGWFTKNILSWAVATILFGVQIFSSYNIEFLIFISDGNVVTSELFSYVSLMSYVNMLFFSVCLLLFFYDIFADRKYLGGDIR